MVALQLRQTVRLVWFTGMLFVYGKVVEVMFLAEYQGDDIHGRCLCDAGDSQLGTCTEDVPRDDDVTVGLVSRGRSG